MTEIKTVSIGPISIANDQPYVLISGPCQMESLKHARKIAVTCERLDIPFIFKASYDKTNCSLPQLHGSHRPYHPVDRVRRCAGGGADGSAGV
jgi:3-deoxy-D-manno-octulosonic acid (KDO) 8-phosphate synthase